MTGVSAAFEKAGADGRAALIGYLPAGFPTVEGAVAAATALAEAGVNVQTAMHLASHSDAKVHGLYVMETAAMQRTWAFLSSLRSLITAGAATLASEPNGFSANSTC